MVDQKGERRREKVTKNTKSVSMNYLFGVYTQS
jgi:hypothetical protein